MDKTFDEDDEVGFGANAPACVVAKAEIRRIDTEEFFMVICKKK